jgi:hypothetical protein
MEKFSTGFFDSDSLLPENLSQGIDFQIKLTTCHSLEKKAVSKQRFGMSRGQTVMRSIIFITVFCCLLAACSKSSEEGTRMRIYNSSDVVFDSVIVKSPGGNNRYYAIQPNSFSSYQPFEFIYSYAYIEVHFDSQFVKLQPIDYVGEQSLKPGAYTYSLDVVRNQPAYLILECKKD